MYLLRVSLAPGIWEQFKMDMFSESPCVDKQVLDSSHLPVQISLPVDLV